jgi:hypothetical protein
MTLNQPPFPRESPKQGSAELTPALPPPPFGAAQTLKRLHALLDGDEQDHRDTWEFLRTALDEDRFSDRKLFP